MKKIAFVALLFCSVSAMAQTTTYSADFLNAKQAITLRSIKVDSLNKGINYLTDNTIPTALSVKKYVANRLDSLGLPGNVGIGTQSPAQKLHVVGNFQLQGAFMPNGSAGTNGQVLTSRGSGLYPIWTTPSGGGGSQDLQQTLINGATSTIGFSINDLDDVPLIDVNAAEGAPYIVMDNTSLSGTDRFYKSFFTNQDLRFQNKTNSNTSGLLYDNNIFTVSSQDTLKLKAGKGIYLGSNYATPLGQSVAAFFVDTAFGGIENTVGAITRHHSSANVDYVGGFGLGNQVAKGGLSKAFLWGRDMEFKAKFLDMKTDSVKIKALEGSGTRMVVADADGLLSTAMIPGGGGGSQTLQEVFDGSISGGSVWGKTTNNVLALDAVNGDGSAGAGLRVYPQGAAMLQVANAHNITTPTDGGDSHVYMDQDSLVLYQSTSNPAELFRTTKVTLHRDSIITEAKAGQVLTRAARVDLFAGSETEGTAIAMTGNHGLNIVAADEDGSSTVDVYPQNLQLSGRNFIRLRSADIEADFGAGTRQLVVDQDGHVLSQETAPVEPVVPYFQDIVDKDLTENDEMYGDFGDKPFYFDFYHEVPGDDSTFGGALFSHNKFRLEVGKNYNSYTLVDKSTIDLDEDAINLSVSREGSEGAEAANSITIDTNLVQITGKLKVVTGFEGAGKVLTSDAVGNATWEDLPGGGSTPILSDIITATFGAGQPWTVNTGASGQYYFSNSDVQLGSTDGTNVSNVTVVPGNITLQNFPFGGGGVVSNVKVMPEEVQINTPVLKIPLDGTAGAGKVLTSDAFGTASWQDVTGSTLQGVVDVTAAEFPGLVQGALGTNDLLFNTSQSGKSAQIFMDASAGTIALESQAASSNTAKVQTVGDSVIISSVVSSAALTASFDATNGLRTSKFKFNNSTAGAGKILTSDASGNATWQAPTKDTVGVQWPLQGYQNGGKDSIRVNTSTGALTHGSTTTWDYSTNINKTWTITGNATLAITNDQDGSTGVLLVTQDGTGGRTITFPVGDNTTGVTQNTAAGAKTLYTYIKLGSVRYWNATLR